MARCPFALQRILPENTNQTPIKPRAIILHTAVDGATPNSSIHGYFARGDVGVESHFYVMDNGTIEQYMDTEIRADANADANAFAISIETEDDGNPSQNKWTQLQLDSIVKLVDWLCTVHGIPRRRIESWDGAGIGWHAMWGAPSRWTPAVGKTCPGGPRIWQTQNDVIPRVISRGLKGENELSPDDIEAIMARLENAVFTPPGRETGQTRTFRKLIEDIQGYGVRTEQTQKAVDELRKVVDEIRALLLANAA